MPEKKMKNIKREMIEQKLNLVVEKLMNLGGSGAVRTSQNDENTGK